MEEKNTKVNIKIIVPIIIFVVIILVVCIIIGINETNRKNAENQEAQKIKEYNELINSTISLMFSSEIKIEKHCNMIYSIWYDAINKNNTVKTSKYTQKNKLKYTTLKEFVDFNTAISNYLNDDEIIEDILKIDTSVKEVKKNMTELSTIPNQDYQKSYDKLVEMYGIYNTLYEMVISPEGSYIEYASKSKKNIGDFKSNYNQITVMVPKLEN